MLETLVSIIVPATGEDTATDATLTAVLVQSHQLIEVLLVGSPDFVRTMRERKLDPRVRTIPVNTVQDNLASALNTGMQEARGAYICFARPGIVVGRDWVQAKLHLMQARGLYAAYQGGPGARDIFARDLIEGAWITLEAVMIHRMVLAEGFRFHSTTLGMGDPAALALLARSRPLVSLAH